MCGICGQFNFKDHAPVSRHDLMRMARSIAHRGPDDEGYYVDGSLGFGFRRLSIIDLAGGHQPMSDASESVWLVFNGEIYNYKELRQQLEAFGHIFRTSSDTEVILHGYKQWGDEVLNRLNGMFGVAIWDVRKKRLMVARDPFGIKPVYYRIDEGRLSFGSEIRAVAAASDESAQVDPHSLNLFLRYRYTPSPRTMFAGIKKLAPGSMLIAENGTCSVRQWYKYKPEPMTPGMSVAQAEEHLLDLYKKAMQRHLLSDVPVGLLLSGGVDSGLLLALMNMYGSSWKTYTVGYGSSFADDELADARKTAEMFSSQHAEVILNQTTFEEMLSEIVGCVEEPIASSSIVPMYFVCKRAREDVKVALIGQGPDELFGGYRRHLGVRYGFVWGSMPNWVQDCLSSGISALPRNEALKRGVSSLGAGDRLQRYQNVLSLMPGHEIDALFHPGMLGGETQSSMPEQWKEMLPLMSRTDELGGFQFLEIRSTLPDELLMYADKLSMAHGLEARVPYLDREIVEFVERLPANFKIRRGSQKWLHRRICRQLLPESILKRKKRGFGVNVVDQWFRGAVNSRMKDVLLDEQSLIYQYLRPSSVQHLFDRHQSGQGDHHKLLFSLIVCEEWLRKHSSQQSTAVPA